MSSVRSFDKGLPSRRWASVFAISEEVSQALADGKPVVALESTIITHGMKYPHNYKTAKEVEGAIRQENAVPATIAVVNGKIRIGLNDIELEKLASNQKNCVKISRRDFPHVISQNLSGGTTVSGTMIVAHKVGIPVFVTGGIGGVHREGEHTMDVSADLTELGKTPVAVISSGVKSILDIPKTLEYLETQGVAVATYGPTKEFPAFYCSRSGYDAPYNLNTITEAAKFIQSGFDLGLGSGMLIAVPIPEEYSLDESKIEEAIQEGLKEAKEKNVRGKEVTPFLLSWVSETTQGMSLESNIALIKNNASVGAKISVELAKLRQNRSRKEPENPRKRETSAHDVVVVGGTNLDFVVSVEDENLKPKAVFFTCIDSRMIPTRFTETCVGDMFVVRNAGNVIPHSRYYPDEVTTNEPAALELACVANKVRHIIVCGHSDCKAMNLLYSLRNEEYSSQTNRRISPLRAWMCAHASSSLERFLKMQEEGVNGPLVFEAETPLRKFVAYIDPENKFRTEDKLSQMDGRTVKGKMRECGGGVGRNIADALGKLQCNPCFISAVGDEKFGSVALETIPHVSAKGIMRLKEANTAICMVLCDHTGECLVLVGDMDIHDHVTPARVSNHVGDIAASSLVVLDGNLSQETIEYVLRVCRDHHVPAWFEPTDVLKASKPFINKLVPLPQFISPNLLEFRRIFQTVYPSQRIDESDVVRECVEKGYMLAKYIDNIIITLGEKGVMVIRKGKETDKFFVAGDKPKILETNSRVSHRIYKPLCVGADEIVNVSGAGDCFASGFIAAMLRGETEERCVQFGFRCSSASLRCDQTVPEAFHI